MNKHKECIICLDDIEDNNIKSCYKCKNVYHKSCWILNKNHYENKILINCPICKRIIDIHIYNFIKRIGDFLVFFVKNLFELYEYD